MKHWLWALGLALLALAVPLSAPAATTDDISADYVAMMSSFGTTATPPGDGADVAVGDATGIGPNALGTMTVQREIRFAATSNLTSGTAEGTLWQDLATDNPAAGTFRARVICLSVNGNVATVGAITEQSAAAAVPVGSPVIVTVYDNGRSGDPAPDAFSLTYVDEGPPVVDGQCVTPPRPPNFVVQNGDIKVHDGQG